MVNTIPYIHRISSPYTGVGRDVLVPSWRNNDKTRKQTIINYTFSILNFYVFIRVAADFGVAEYLAAVKSGLPGKNEAEHAYHGEDMQIGSAEHLYAQYDRGQRRIGAAAEQSHKANRRGKARVKTKQAAYNAAKSGADGEGGYYFAAFEARGQGNGSEEQLQYKVVPIGVTLQGAYCQVHARAVEALVACQQGHYYYHRAACKYAQPGIFDKFMGKVLSLMKNEAHGDVQKGYQQSQQRHAPQQVEAKAHLRQGEGLGMSP